MVKTIAGIVLFKYLYLVTFINNYQSYFRYWYVKFDRWNALWWIGWKIISHCILYISKKNLPISQMFQSTLYISKAFQLFSRCIAYIFEAKRTKLRNIQYASHCLIVAQNGLRRRQKKAIVTHLYVLWMTIAFIFMSFSLMFQEHVS